MVTFLVAEESEARGGSAPAGSSGVWCTQWAQTSWLLSGSGGIPSLPAPPPSFPSFVGGPCYLEQLLGAGISLQVTDKGTPRLCFSGQSWFPDHSRESCGSMWRHQIQGLMGMGCPAALRALCAHQWDTDYANSYKKEYVCVYVCMHMHASTHTHTHKFHSLPVKWKLGLDAVLVSSPLHFRPVHVPANRQGIV